MALGIGVNTAIFTVINSVLLRPLSWREPDRLVQFSLRGACADNYAISPSKLGVLLEHPGAFEEISAYEPRPTPRILTGDATEQVNTVRVSSAYFRLLGERGSARAAHSQQRKIARALGARPWSAIDSGSGNPSCWAAKFTRS
ncbi:MAG: hypothetical protein SFV51_03685 [Bryobacteraceae bacterium]|nr:hypothetical protein [Bryobacteraceae bacterium]